MSDYYKCVTLGCEQVFFEPVGRCPQCGLPQITPTRFRVNLALMFISGLFITVVMAPVLYYLVPSMLGADDSFAELSPATVLALLAILVLTFAVGLAGTISVVLDFARGGRTKGFARFIRITLIALIAVVALVFAIEPMLEVPGRRLLTLPLS